MAACVYKHERVDDVMQGLKRTAVPRNFPPRAFLSYLSGFRIRVKDQWSISRIMIRLVDLSRSFIQTIKWRFGKTCANFGPPVRNLIWDFPRSNNTCCKLWKILELVSSPENLRHVAPWPRWMGTSMWWPATWLEWSGGAFSPDL